MTIQNLRVAKNLRTKNQTSEPSLFQIFGHITLFFQTKKKKMNHTLINNLPIITHTSNEKNLVLFQMIQGPVVISKQKITRKERPRSFYFIIIVSKPQKHKPQKNRITAKTMLQILNYV